MEDLKAKWRRTFQYQLQYSITATTTKRTTFAIMSVDRCVNRGWITGNIVKGDKPNCRTINIVLCSHFIKHICIISIQNYTKLKHLPCIIIFFIFNEHILNNLEQPTINFFFLIWESLGSLITFIEVTTKCQDLNLSLI